ncbi:DUF885 family protein [Streptomyces sp. NPDC090077]|uniref:DUF885 family protein n=1 Tax=Streptomyces sp. NPDC090077 TaxID=3365938 RepID=UPI0038158151
MRGTADRCRADDGGGRQGRPLPSPGRHVPGGGERLRSARVGVDIALAVGGVAVPEAAELLVREVPLDAATAHHEAAFFALTSGQILPCQAGKTQVLALPADARRLFGERFELRRFHHHLWRNGNVPLPLLRWEYLGDREEVDRADALVTASA